MCISDRALFAALQRKEDRLTTYTVEEDEGNTNPWVI